MKDFHLMNLALLCKWRWRMLHHGSGVWREIIRARYGGVFPAPHLGGRLGELRRSSLWWKDMSLLGTKVGLVC